MKSISISNRVIRNNIEQYLFMLPASLACAAFLDSNPSSWMRFMVVGIVIWTIARIFFWLGYAGYLGTRRERVVGVSMAFHIAELMWAYSLYRTIEMLFV